MSAHEAVIPGDVLKQGRGLNWWQLYPHSLHRRRKKQDMLSFKSCSLDSVNDSVRLLLKSWGRGVQAACCVLREGVVLGQKIYIVDIIFFYICFSFSFFLFFEFRLQIWPLLPSVQKLTSCNCHVTRLNLALRYIDFSFVSPHISHQHYLLLKKIKRRKHFFSWLCTSLVGRFGRKCLPNDWMWM